MDSSSAPERKGARVVEDYHEWIFDARYFDWLNTENEQALTAYAPPRELNHLLESSIDLESE